MCRDPARHRPSRRPLLLSAGASSIPGPCFICILPLVLVTKRYLLPLLNRTAYSTHCGGCSCVWMSAPSNHRVPKKLQLSHQCSVVTNPRSPPLRDDPVGRLLPEVPRALRLLVGACCGCMALVRGVGVGMDRTHPWWAFPGQGCQEPLTRPLRVVWAHLGPGQSTAQWSRWSV